MRCTWCFKKMRWVRVNGGYQYVCYEKHVSTPSPAPEQETECQ